jgi:predicted PurR-regulated permease PerM
MSEAPTSEFLRMGARRFRRAFLLLLVVGISVLFLIMVRQFVMSVFLAAIFAGLSYPLFSWLLEKTRGRANTSSLLTILILLVGVGLPLAGFLTVVATQAVQVSQGAGEWFESQDAIVQRARSLVERVPFVDRLLPETEAILAQARSALTSTGPLLMGVVSAATRGALNFILQLFVLLYALFFFLVDGRSILRKILYYMPLDPDEEAQLLERFTSVTRATLKGSLLIGVIQGGLAGLAFWIAGVPGSAFWGTVMVVLSIIPAVGSALVWIPAVIYLFVDGQVPQALGLLAWCAVVVGSVDNFLRPQLIGRDARMSDLLILLSTLGGIALFGAVGFIVGPVVAALFVTIWHLYGEAFRDVLPEVPAGVSLLGNPPPEEPQPLVSGGGSENS